MTTSNNRSTLPHKSGLPPGQGSKGKHNALALPGQSAVPKSYWDAAASLIATLPDEQQAAATDNVVWLAGLHGKLLMARQVVVSWDRMRFFAAEIVDKRLTAEQRTVAEKWILRGVWQYKNPKTLTLDDFWPTKETIETHCGESVVTSAQHRRIVEAVSKAAFESGKKEGLVEATTTKDIPVDSQVWKEWVEERRQWYMKMLDQSGEKADLLEENRRLGHENERLRRKLGLHEAKETELRDQLRSMSAKMQGIAAVAFRPDEVGPKGHATSGGAQ